MNNKKIISYLMMQTLDAVDKARQFLSIDNKDAIDWERVDVQLKNISYYARMIIEKDGVE